VILSEFLNKEGLKGVFYGRHSTNDQNVDTQRHICYEFASKYGITIMEEFVDEGVSAFKKSLDKRQQLDLLRKKARERHFDCVLVYKADRLARRIDQHMQLWGEFRELGIPIILTESEKLYTTDSPTEIMVEIGLSSLESENTRIRTRDNYKSFTAKGDWLGGNLPYGYKYDVDENGDSIIVSIPDRIEHVKEIFNLYRRGYGFKRISNIMNEQSPKRNETGYGKWVAASIKSIITNPFYAGYNTAERVVPGAGNSIQDRSQWTVGQCKKIPSVITEEEWNHCMEIYEKKKGGQVSQNSLLTPYLFIDVLYCKDCDEKAIGKNYTSGKKDKNGEHYGGKYYICSSCKQKWDVEKVNEELINEFLTGWHFQFFSKQKKELQAEVMEKVQKDINEIKAHIQSLKKELFSLTDRLRDVEKKQKSLMEKNPEPDELQHALVQVRISLRKKMNYYEKLIEQKEKEMQQLYLAYGDVENFNTFTSTMTNFEYNLNEPEFRRLILFLLDKVTVRGQGGKYQYELTAKVDLDERGIIEFGSHPSEIS